MKNVHTGVHKFFCVRWQSRVNSEAEILKCNIRVQYKLLKLVTVHEAGVCVDGKLR
jgi:hypothetical protein